jgi:hypothetical protein
MLSGDAAMNVTPRSSRFFYDLAATAVLWPPFSVDNMPIVQ